MNQTYYKPYILQTNHTYYIQTKHVTNKPYILQTNQTCCRQTIQTKYTTDKPNITDKPDKWNTLQTDHTYYRQTRQTKHITDKWNLLQTSQTFCHHQSPEALQTCLKWLNRSLIFSSYFITIFCYKAIKWHPVNLSRTEEKSMTYLSIMLFMFAVQDMLFMCPVTIIANKAVCTLSPCVWYWPNGNYSSLQGRLSQ